MAFGTLIYFNNKFLITKKSKRNKKLPQTKLPILLIKIIIDESYPNETSEDFTLNKPPKQINHDSILDNLPVIDKTPKKESVPFVLAEQASCYAGCTEKSEEDYKMCFNKKQNDLSLKVSTQT